jgi:AcrR family transcriptional regulator
MPTPEPTAADQVRRSMELLWDGPARSPDGTADRPAPGPKPGLTLDRIVDAAITLADRDGIDGVSMRRVATELGVGTMSLYRYVPGKAELLALMLDRVGAPDESAFGGSSWRDTVEAAARGTYRLYLAHPWLLQVNWTRPVLGPNSVASMEIYMRGLDGLGLTGQERIAVVIMVDSYVVGQARQRIQYEAVTVQSGLSDEEFWGQQYPYLEKAMTSGRYPAMAALDDDAFSMGWEDSFEFGLARILDGMAALIEGRVRPARPDPTR